MDELSPGSTIAGLTVDRKLGSGAMGVVYRALDSALQRYVAIKVVAPEHAADPEFRRRFEREARMAAGIDHPNAVPVYFRGDEDGLLFLVTKYVDGTDLDQLVKQQGALDPTVAVRLVAQVAAALDAAHAKGLVHRDVKPANILVGGRPDEPIAYLADFGLTRSTAASSHITMTGMVWGTPAYMAPELYVGDAAGVASDVYALGGTLQTVLVGRRFPRGAVIGEPGSTLTEVLADRATAIALDDVLRRALEPDPAKRYATAGELGRAASAAVRATGASAPPAQVVPAPAPPRWGPPAPVRRPDPAYAPPAGARGGARPGVRPAERAGPSGARGRGRAALLLGAVVAAAAAVVAALLAQRPASGTGAEPAVAAPSVVLQPVVDGGSRAELTWQGPDLDYGIEVTVPGQESTTVLAGRVSTAAVAVEPGVRYCFRVSGTDGGRPLASNVQPFRDATCSGT